MPHTYILTYDSRTKEPQEFYFLPNEQINWSEPPWAFSGYQRMIATSLSEAQAEFEYEQALWKEFDSED